MTKLAWDISNSQKIDDINNYLDGGEILFTICPPHGYVIWAITDIEIGDADIVIYGYGDTEEEAKRNLQINMKRFEEAFNG